MSSWWARVECCRQSLVGVALLVLGLAATSARPAGAGCQSNVLLPGDSTRTMTFGGMSRTYNLHVPPGYNPFLPTPLVMDIHGYTGTASGQANVSGFRALSDAQGFVVVWPQGYSNSWN